MALLSRELLDYYLQEVEDLRTFLRAHAESVRRARPDEPLPLDVADPDVQRLIEGIAFFSARTRAVATRNVRSAWQRIFQQYFDYLLSPLPTCGMLQVLPVSQADPQRLPVGTRLLYTFEDGRQAYFQTAAPLTILPLMVERIARADGQVRGTHRVVITLRLLNLWRGALGRLDFHLNAFDEYHASLLLQHTLKQSLQQVRFFPDADDALTLDDPGAQARAYTCPVSFGPLDPGIPDPEAAPPPPTLEGVRRFFHTPERGLYLSIRVPNLTPRRDRCALVLELDARWPYRELNPNFLQLHVIPVENLVRDTSQPLLFDGTRFSQPLIHPQDELKLEPHSVLGVYRSTRQGPVSVVPRVLGVQAAGFDLEETTYQGRTRLELRYEDPSAALEPALLTGDLLWYQPDLTRAQVTRVIPYARVLQGYRFEHRGSLRLAVDNPIRSSLESLMQILSLRMKTRLSRDELSSLLHALGCFVQGPYQQMPQLIEQLHTELLPAQIRPNGGLKLRYRVTFSRSDETLRPFLNVFMEQLSVLLSHWAGDEAIEVEVLEAQDPTVRDL